MLRGEGADADDGASDLAAEAVGEVLEGLLLGDGWLYLGTPTAHNDPKPVGGEDGEAEGSAQAEDGECEEERGGYGEVERGLPAKGEEVAEGEAGACS